MKRVLVLGGAGFIGMNLVKRLKQDGHYVTAIDRKAKPEWEPSAADFYIPKDLTTLVHGDPLLDGYDEIYQLAAEVGGLGFIMDKNNDVMMLRNSVQINLNVLECVRQMENRPRVFFASSACVYETLTEHDNGAWEALYTSDGRVIEQTRRTACREVDAYPANPDNEYAWEKLFAERLYDAYARNYGIEVRTARFHNCFGPLGHYNDGREKAPAALIRKTILAQGGGEIEMWGDGTQTRSFMYVDDAVEGAIRLMASDFRWPVNIGSSRLISLNDLAATIATIGGKMLTIRHVAGPVGVRGRNSDNTLIKEKLGWEPSYPLELGLVHTYAWIARQMGVVHPPGHAPNEALDMASARV